MKKKIKDNRGFTLIETMIALSFFAIAMLGAGALYIKANEYNKNGNITSSANFLAKTTLEEYKNMAARDIVATDETVSGLTETGSNGGIFTRRVVITNIATGGRKIEITVTWPGASWASDRKFRGGNNNRVVLISNVRGAGL